MLRWQDALSKPNSYIFAVHSNEQRLQHSKQCMPQSMNYWQPPGCSNHIGWKCNNCVYLWHCSIIACLFYADVCILYNSPSQVRLETPLNLPLLHALPPCFFGLVSSSFTLVKRHQISAAALWSSAEMPLKQQRSRFFFWEALFWCALSLSFFNFLLSNFLYALFPSRKRLRMALMW